MKCRSVCLAVVAGLVSFSILGSPAAAAPHVSFGRDDETSLMTSFPNSQAAFNQFTSGLATFGVEDVELLAGFDPTLVFGATGITASASGVLATPAPTFSIGVQALAETDAALFPNAPQVDTSFTFNQPITAFGLFVTQGGDEGVPPNPASNNNPMTFRLTDTVTSAFTDVMIQVGPGWGFNNAFFVGITDVVPFDRVTIIETGDLLDGVLYDNIVAGNVPEPGSLVLAGLAGACALGYGARSRRR